MPVSWKLFRIVCIIQMLLAASNGILALIRFFEDGSFSAFIRILLFLLIFLLTILAVNILNNNYPDVPVAGKQKTSFNRIFLLNFLFLIFLFGIIFAEYRQLNTVADFVSRPVLMLPFQIFISIIISLITLVFQFIILYGLYQLRRELYFNFMKKEFEFEKNQTL